jgi:hypothetical protein
MDHKNNKSHQPETSLVKADTLTAPPAKPLHVVSDSNQDVSNGPISKRGAGANN